MTANQFREALKRLGLSTVKAAKLFDADRRTTRRWADDERTVPPTVAILLRLLMRKKLTADDIEEAKTK